MKYLTLNSDPTVESPDLQGPKRPLKTEIKLYNRD